ncbi:MAG: hypothetical protein ACHQQQ_03640 [Bacteroidota bacterium]
MRTLIFTIILTFWAGTLFAGGMDEPASISPAFEKMKSMAGTWNGTTDDSGKVSINYQVVSSGSAVMEMLNVAQDSATMITMYHMNGKNLMMTHYCSAGNQPRMKADGAMKDPNKLAFTFVDATNLAGPKDGYMKKLVLTFKDADHFTEEWTFSKDGVMGHPKVFNFERVK